MMDPSLFVRQLVALSPARYAHVVFIGAVLGMALNALQQWAGPTYNAESWAVISLGITLVLLPYWLVTAARRTKRIQSELELLEVVVQRGKLSEVEQRRLYREVAQRLADAIGEEADRSTGERASKAAPQRELPG